MMSRKHFFRSLLSVASLSFFMLTSCVNYDMYDLYDDDISLLIPRRKYKTDGGENNEIAQAIIWVNTHSITAGENECLAYALYNYSYAYHGIKGKSLPSIRFAIMAEVYPNMSDAALRYKNAVTNGGIELSREQEENIIKNVVGATPKSKSQWEQKFKNKSGSGPFPGKIIVGTSRTHIGVLVNVSHIYYPYEQYRVHLKDQDSSNSIFGLEDVEAAYW